VGIQAQVCKHKNEGDASVHHFSFFDVAVHFSFFNSAIIESEYIFNYTLCKMDYEYVAGQDTVAIRKIYGDPALSDIDKFGMLTCQIEYLKCRIVDFSWMIQSQQAQLDHKREHLRSLEKQSVDFSDCVSKAAIQVATSALNDAERSLYDLVGDCTNLKVAVRTREKVIHAMKQRVPFEL
jgi:hypothetical protein